MHIIVESTAEEENPTEMIVVTNFSTMLSDQHIRLFSPILIFHVLYIVNNALSLEPSEDNSPQRSTK